MINSLINTFFPKVCGGCDSLLLTSEDVLCTDCRHNIPLTNHHQNFQNEAMTKFYGRIPVEFAGAFIYFHKKGIVQKLIHNLKYKGHQEIGTVMGLWYGEILAQTAIFKTVDVIIPVPLHRKKLKERGYNQVDEFGIALSDRLGLHFDRNILIRNVYSKTQTFKNMLSRSEVGGGTMFEANFSADDCNKHYLIIDDVLTTGSTLEACCRAMLKIPGARISIACLAMSHS